MNIVPIVFAFDEKLVMPAGVCITSLLENALPDTFYDIYIIHETGLDLSSTLLTALPQVYENCKITFREITNEFSNAFEIRGITTPAYFRLLIPEVIPEYDKIMYSDVDVIFRDDLLELYNEDLGDYYFAGVRVVLDLRPEVMKYVTATLGLNPQEGYFYSGNLILNSKKIREDNKIAEFRELARNKYIYQDMDVLNLACKGKIKTISPYFCLTNFVYNFLIKNRAYFQAQYTEDDIERILTRGVVHFNGEKPWKGWCVNQDIWWAYYRKSLFFSEDFCCGFYAQNDKMSVSSLIVRYLKSKISKMRRIFR